MVTKCMPKHIKICIHFFMDVYLQKWLLEPPIWQPKRTLKSLQPFIEFLIDNWFIVIPLIFSLLALYLLDRISKAINLEPHKGVVLINKKNALVIDIRSQKEFDEGKISQARHVGPDLEVCKKEIAKADGKPVILVCQKHNFCRF